MKRFVYFLLCLVGILDAFDRDMHNFQRECGGGTLEKMHLPNAVGKNS